VLVLLGDALVRSGLVLNASRASAVSHMGVVDDGCVLNDRGVDVGVVDDRGVDVHHRGVISKVVAVPFSAGKAHAHIAKTVIHTTVVAHVRSPIAVMEPVTAAEPSPVAWRPQRAIVWGRNPGTGNPVIAIVTPTPVTGCPHQAGFWARRLIVNGKHWRSQLDIDEKLCFQS
jgi:hypothetical protein